MKKRRLYQLALGLCVGVFSFGLEATPLNLKDKISLKEIECFAFENNRDLKALKETLEQGYYRKHEAYGRWYPAVNFDGEIIRTAQGGNRGYAKFYRSSLGFSQRIFSPDDYFNVKLRQLDYKILGIDLDVFCNDLLFQVREAYLNVLLFLGEVRVRKESVNLLKEAYEEDQARYDVGTIPLFDVNQSRVTYTNSLADLYVAERDYRVAVNSLLDLMGLGPECEPCIDLDAENPSIKTTPLVFDKLQTFAIDECGNEKKEEIDTFFDDPEICEWECLALDSRPDVRRAEEEISLSEEFLRSKYGEYLPNLETYANYNNNSPGGIGFVRPNSFWDMGVRLNWPLFDGLQRESRIAEARSAVSESKFRYQQTVIDAKIAVRNQFHNLDTAMLVFISAREGADLARQSVEEGFERRREGVITPLEYRDAVNSFTDAQNQLNTATYQLLIQYYGLLREAGLGTCEPWCLDDNKS